MKISGIFKPEYFYQPKRAWKRLLPFHSPSKAEFIEEKLPWGMSIRARPMEEHGRIISTLGVIDLAVTETLWRLSEPGEIAVDVGANIGYMTAVMAARVGSIEGGHVWAFEAHPEVFKELKYNIEKWQVQLTKIKIEIEQIAISERQGTVMLGTPNSFAANRGLSSVIASENIDNEPALRGLKTASVKSVSLDDLFPSPKKIGILKLDVEGHELSVLKGAKSLLSENRIRDCVFEEHGEYPTPVTKKFEENGYSVFRIQRKFFGPELLLPDSKIRRTRWEPTSFIATKQPERVVERFKKSGWKALQGNK